MNKYFAIAGLVMFVIWSGFMYYEGRSKESAVCGQADAKHDLEQAAITAAAQKGVITTIEKQQTITKEVDNDYEIKKLDIDRQYANSFGGVWGQPAAPASNRVPTTGAPTGRPNATTSRQFLTRIFKLNAKECDENTEHLYGLQAWVNGQQKVK